MLVEPWVIFVLIATVMRGTYSFLLKVITVQKRDYDFMILLISFFGFLFAFTFFKFELIDMNLIALAVLIASLHFITFKMSFKILENISASIYFIGFRTCATMLIILTGTFFFQEYLNLKQIIGIALGILTLFLLYDNKDVPSKQSNFKYGIMLLAIFILLQTIINTTNKYIATSVDVGKFIFYYFFFLTLIALMNFLIYRRNSISKEVLRDKSNYVYAIIMGGLFTFLFYSILRAYSTGYLILVFKIFSFEIMIPIILSIIIYKERLTKRKIFAFVFTVFTILLLV